METLNFLRQQLLELVVYSLKWSLDSEVNHKFYMFESCNKLIQFGSVTQSCPTLCNPMDCNTPGLPVYHQLPELTQTHIRCVGGAIQPSHPLSSPSPPAFDLFQHQGLFQMSQFIASSGQSIGVSISASVLPMNIQDSFP